jgi:hypothetical protein
VFSYWYCCSYFIVIVHYFPTCFILFHDDKQWAGSPSNILLSNVVLIEKVILLQPSSMPIAWQLIYDKPSKLFYSFKTYGFYESYMNKHACYIGYNILLSAQSYKTRFDGVECVWCQGALMSFKGLTLRRLGPDGDVYDGTGDHTTMARRLN